MPIAMHTDKRKIVQLPGPPVPVALRAGLLLSTLLFALRPLRPLR
jgi:hypothetical protein